MAEQRPGFRLSERDVDTVARMVKLPLATGRSALVLSTLTAWLHGIDELNAKMSRREHQTTMPIVTFGHSSRGR